MVKQICELLIKLSERYPDRNVLQIIYDSVNYAQPTLINSHKTNSFLLTCLQVYSTKE